MTIFEQSSISNFKRNLLSTKIPPKAIVLQKFFRLIVLAWNIWWQSCINKMPHRKIYGPRYRIGRYKFTEWDVHKYYLFYNNARIYTLDQYTTFLMPIFGWIFANTSCSLYTSNAKDLSFCFRNIFHICFRFVYFYNCILITAPNRKSTTFAMDVAMRHAFFRSFVLDKVQL